MADAISFSERRPADGQLVTVFCDDIAQRSRRPSTAPSSDERQHAIQQAAEFPAEIADDADRQPLADKR